MTRSPLLSTLLPLIPLAALGWPLARVIHQEDYVPIEVEEPDLGPLVSADLFVRSAHPFEKIEVSLDDTKWTFAPEDEVKEIYIPKSGEAFLTINVIWPEGTPETAVLFTLEPSGVAGIEHTLWGQGDVTDQIKFTWEPEL